MNTIPWSKRGEMQNFPEWPVPLVGQNRAEVITAVTGDMNSEN